MLVVGQYFPYKGMDIAAEAARALPDINFKFVGTGERTELFISENHLRELPNVNVIPFLQKEELAEEYRKCRLLVLPSRRECWGLVINEAASFGTPIVSTFESGAGVEFLFDEYPFLLATPCDVLSLKNTIKAAVNMKGIEEYSQYLIKKSKNYSIERSVMCHLKAFNEDGDCYGKGTYNNSGSGI